MPRRSSFPALGISSLWNALPSSGQRPTQRAQSLNQPLALSRIHPAPHCPSTTLVCICVALRCWAAADPLHCDTGWLAGRQGLTYWHFGAGPASAGLAEEIPARARLLGALPAHGHNRGDKLGLQSHLLPYWQAGVDPTEAWHAYEKHIRVVYAK